jgi:hypothetical protein
MLQFVTCRIAHVLEQAMSVPGPFLKATFKSYLPGWAYVVLPLKLLQLPFLGLILLGKASNDLANLMREQIMTGKYWIIED